MDEADALGLRALAPPSVEDGFGLVHSWLGRAETVGAAYQAWEALRSQYASTAQSYARRSAALRLYGEFILGAASQAEGGCEGGRGEGLGIFGPAIEAFIGISHQRLEEISQKWASAQSQMRCFFEQASEEIEQEIVRRADRTLAVVRPKLHLSIHSMGKGRCILQFERIDELTSVLLSRLISGKVPTCEGFLFDDSVSQAGDADELLYTSSLSSPSVFPPWPLIRDFLNDKTKLSAPWKGQIPILCEGDILWILKQKGIVMEVEQVAMADARSCEVLEIAKAQKVVAHFLRWMREGRIELQLKPNEF